MIKKTLLIFLLFFGVKSTFSQYVKLSVYSEVSIITVGPGKELFEAFGHSAIRIKDPVLQLDLVYNYGMFDFNAPNFYLNFVKGDLLYQLARYPFYIFEESNKQDKRWMKAQLLNLSQEQRQQYFEFLETNSQPENASYYYDPYYNNCASKLGDISYEILKNKLTFSDDYVLKNETLRSLMLKEIPWNTWSAFGINLLLGTKLDKIATASEYLYLPDYVYLAFKNGTILIKNNNEKLVKKETILLDFEEKKPSVLFWNPFLIFSLLTFLTLFITYKDVKNTNRTKILDFLLFFITGSLGFVIVYLWFFSNHITAVTNFNFLWCFAPNFFIAFLMLKTKFKKWIISYLQGMILFLIAIPIIWIIGIQSFPKSAIPLFILVLVRYLYLLKTLLPSKK